jgi:GNAT superfamily N-acetyltransferase
VKQLIINGQLLSMRRATMSEIVDLRHVVLRTGLPREMAIFPGDDATTSWHFGVFCAEKNVGCATFHLNSWQAEPAWQLRGMATDPALQGKGTGSALLKFAEQTLLENSPLRLFWCNARKPAVNFYRKHGWQTVGEEFVIETAGPHFKMFKRV